MRLKQMGRAKANGSGLKEVDCHNVADPIDFHSAGPPGRPSEKKRKEKREGTTSSSS
jgi:hypothetical protein